ncbi:PD-(D/E)XK nuclease family protein [Flavobacteriales bacterium]|jgi:CRISPR/Cas system-associated exonuclease Cas4 (RecB family)|nr:PD-(D/E)XK nuclease family protein [Flavobacteriales bacterium]
MIKTYRGKYNPNRPEYFKISRSKVEFYLNCKRCFFLDRKLGIGQPPGFPFNLNSAVDSLLKNEFDQYRETQKPHPYIKKIGINAVPFKHEKIEEWRFNFKGVSYNHESLKFHVFGAVDDLWINLDNNELIVVDYKSTSKAGEVTLDADWQIGYKRQMEFYQHLLRRNGFKVSDTGYFVYCNGINNKPRFDKKMDFKISLIPYIGNDNWVESTLNEIHSLLNQDHIPEHSKTCKYCDYQMKTSTL